MARSTLALTPRVDNVDDVMAEHINTLQTNQEEIWNTLSFVEATELTIDAAGAITVTQNYHTVDTNADAASDNLDTITISGNIEEGTILIIRPDNDARTVVVRHNQGNIMCNGNADITLDDSHDFAFLVYDETLVKWMAFGGGLSNVVDDLTPELGGDLSLNGHNIDFPTTANISDCLDEDDMATNSATMLATQQSIKAYVDNETDYDLIEDANASGGAVASFDFTTIPATYKHLRLICSLRSDNAATSDTMRIRFNNVSTNTYYSLYYIISHNASLTTAEYLAAAEIVMTGTCGDTSPADTFVPADIYIPNYTSANINKIAYVSAGTFFNTTTGNIAIRNGLGVSDNTPAISRITIYPGTGANWKQYSRISLYGMN